MGAPAYWNTATREFVLPLNERHTQLLSGAAYGHQKLGIFIRCCTFNQKKKAFEDSFPKGSRWCLVTSLGTQTLEDSQMHNRFRPVEVTQLVLQLLQHRQRASINLQISQSNHTNYPTSLANYTVSVFIGAKLSPEYLCQKLQAAMTDADLCQMQIEAKLSEQQRDEDIKVGRTFVSLNCPLSQSRIQVPCRGVDCMHIQCFDAVFYLKMNERKPMWKCPVCQKPAKYGSLRVDGLFNNIVKEAPPAAQDIEFSIDGTWKCREVVDAKPKQKDTPPRKRIRTDAGDGGGASGRAQVPPGHNAVVRRDSMELPSLESFTAHPLAASGLGHTQFNLSGASASQPMPAGAYASSAIGHPSSAQAPQVGPTALALAPGCRGPALPCPADPTQPCLLQAFYIGPAWPSPPPPPPRRPCSWCLLDAAHPSVPSPYGGIARRHLNLFRPFHGRARTGCMASAGISTPWPCPRTRRTQ